MGGAFEHLIMNTNTLVIGSVAERSLVRLQLREVFIRGLRERTLHNSSDVFVEISITGMNWVIKSPISSSPTSPSWPMGNLAGWFIPATSVLKFSVFRHHRVRPDELIAEVEGSAWTFLHNQWVPPTTKSEDSPKMVLKAVMQLANAEPAEERQGEAECRLGCERDRLDDFHKRHDEKAGRWKTTQDVLLETLKFSVNICQTLDSMAEGIPVCKAASVVLHTVMKGLKKLIEKRKDVDSEIVQLIKSLHEAVAEASHGASTIKGEAAKVAGECALLLDKWISTTIGVQLIKAGAGSIQDQLSQCHELLSSFKEKLKGTIPCGQSNSELASGVHDIHNNSK